MNEEQYLLRISQLEKEIEYLHGLLDEAGISYKREAKDNCGECKNQKYKELKGKVLYEHLMWKKEDVSDVIGLYPMFPDETINFLVFDFDCHDDNLEGDDGANPYTEWMTEVNTFRRICEINEVPILVERSSTG